MEGKKQKIITIAIGLVLTALLMFIGIRVLQGRASRANQPTSFTATRSDADSCKLSAVTETEIPLLTRYGATTPTFFFRFDASDITPQGDGSYLQEAQIDQLSESRVTFVVEGNESITAICDPFSGSASNSDTSAGLGVLPTTAAPTTAPAVPTVEPTTEVTAEPEPDPEALTVEAAAAFYDEPANEDAFISDCVKEFEDTYFGLASACTKAYMQQASN